MVELLAKKYCKALVEGKDVASIQKYFTIINEISSAYGDEKFLTIIASNEVSVENKINLILSFVENTDVTLNRFIQVLGANKRLDIIPAISCELASYLADLTKNYTGIVYSNEILNESYMKDLEEKFSSKFNVTLNFSNKVGNYDGIKVEIDGLGIEIGLSKDRLKSQMIEHILKAV